MLSVCLVVVLMFALFAIAILMLAVALCMLGWCDDILPDWDDDGLTNDGKGR